MGERRKSAEQAGLIGSEKPTLVEIREVEATRYAANLLLSQPVLRFVEKRRIS